MLLTHIVFPFVCVYYLNGYYSLVLDIPLSFPLFHFRLSCHIITLQKAVDPLTHARDADNNKRR